jgi:hypothetical protein
MRTEPVFPWILSSAEHLARLRHLLQEEVCPQFMTLRWVINSPKNKEMGAPLESLI